MNESERRTRLHELDSILDGLERLNLRDAKELPASLRERLHDIGVEAGPRSNVTKLIERVWELQEQFLRSGGSSESRTGLPPQRGPQSFTN
jgi:hypothetical protein